jgi:hypothetical protein
MAATVGDKTISEKVNKRWKNLLFVLIGAIIFAFLVGILSSLAVSYALTRLFNLDLFVIALALTAMVSYLLYYYYVLEPNSTIIKDLVIPIIYDRGTATIIEDPFDGYLPQQAARAAFERYRNDHPEQATEKIKENMGIGELKRFVITDLVEYLLIVFLHAAASGFGIAKLEKEETKELPANLANNIFVSYFKNLKPQGIGDIQMKQVDLVLPQDIKLTYASPAKFKNTIIDPNSFELSFKGNMSKLI